MKTTRLWIQILAEHFLIVLTFLGIIFSLITNSHAATPTWMIILSKESAVNICGDSSIQNTESSLKKNFFLGNPKRGYAFTGLLSYANYWKILKENSAVEAKDKIKKAFSRTSLWEIEPDGTSRYLGSPKTVESEFSVSVKDCAEGKDRPLGGTCSGTMEERVACCSEKFPGPVVTWKYKEKEYKLDYSPDPSVSFRISDSKEPRYCQVQQSYGK